MPTSEDEFANHEFVLMNIGSMTFHAWLEARIPPDQIVMECDSYNGLSAAILSRFGIGPMGVSIADAAPSLHRCIPPPEGLGITTWFLASPQAQRRAEVRTFTHFVAPPDTPPC